MAAPLPTELEGNSELLLRSWREIMIAELLNCWICWNCWNTAVTTRFS